MVKQEMKINSIVSYKNRNKIISLFNDDESMAFIGDNCWTVRSHIIELCKLVKVSDLILIKS